MVSIIEVITQFKPFFADFIGFPSNPAVPGYVDPSAAASRIASFFTLFFTFSTIMATFFFIRGGLDYIMSGGDPQKVKTGQMALQYSVLGLIISGIGFLAISIVKNLLGIDNIDLNL